VINAARLYVVHMRKEFISTVDCGALPSLEVHLAGSVCCRCQRRCRDIPRYVPMVDDMARVDFIIVI
jgi:hypothetical protein